jgi:hypothetical protein
LSIKEVTVAHEESTFTSALSLALIPEKDPDIVVSRAPCIIQEPKEVKGEVEGSVKYVTPSSVSSTKTLNPESTLYTM